MFSDMSERERERDPKPALNTFELANESGKIWTWKKYAVDLFFFLLTLLSFKLLVDFPTIYDKLYLQSEGWIFGVGSLISEKILAADQTCLGAYMQALHWSSLCYPLLSDSKWKYQETLICFWQDPVQQLTNEKWHSPFLRKWIPISNSKRKLLNGISEAHFSSDLD